MGLAAIVFTKEPTREFEVEGHKIIVKKLTARDSMTLEDSINSVSEDKADMKKILKSFIDLLSVVIIEVDGIKAESKADTTEFLLNLEQAQVSEIFSKAKIFGELTSDDLKKTQETPPSEQSLT